MARFPTYSREVGLSGGVTAPYMSDSAMTAPARALQGAGNALQGFGDQLAQVEAKIRQTQDDVWVSKARSETAIDIDKQERAAQQSATDGAQGYTDTITKSYEDYRKSKVAQAPSADAARKYEMWANGYGVDLTKRSAGFQADSELAKRTSDLATTLSNHEQLVYADPSQYDKVKARAEADLKAASAWLTPEQEVAVRDKFTKDLNLARAKGKVDSDPAGFKAEVGSTVSVPAAKVPADAQGRVSQAMGFFVGRGYTKEQAAGIVGNLMAESNLNPSVKPGDSGTAHGVAQWRGERLTKLQRFANANGKDWHDFETQLAFVDSELQQDEPAAYRALKSAKTVDEATAAFIGFERPQGWSADNPRGGHNYKGRLGYAVAAAGGDVAQYHEGGSYTNDSRYAGLSIDEIRSLSNQADTSIKATQTANYSALKDSFEQSIATGQITSESDIINSGLNGGDVATLLGKFRTYQKEQGAVVDTLSALASGTFSGDPFDSDTRKNVDGAALAIKKKATPDQYQAATESIVQQSGIVPKDTMNELRLGMQSTDPATVATAANKALRISQIDRAALGRRDGGQQVQDDATLYDHYVNGVGMSPEQAAKRLIDAKDPEKAKARASLMESKPIKDFIKDTAVESTVRDIFDPGFFGLDPQLGETPAQSAAMVGEYSSILSESIFDASGDMDAGKALADERFRKIYGPSNFTLSGDKVVTRYPPEVTYPADGNGSWDYVRSQAIEALAGEGVAAKEVFLQPDATTEQDVKAGKPARYQLFYRPYKRDELPAGPTGDFKGMVEKGNIDLSSRPVVNNSDGTISTVRSMSYQNDAGQEVLIPTVSEEGKILSNREAMAYWGKKGQFLGKFDSPANADAYAQALHESQAKYYGSGDTNNIERFMLPFYAIAPTNADTVDQMIAPSEQKMKVNRDRLLQGRDRGRSLDNFLNGNPLTGGM